MTEIPANCLFNKKQTGCGATELAIRNNIPTIIAMPYVALVKNKTIYRKDDLSVLGVYEGVTEQEIIAYATEPFSIEDRRYLRFPATNHQGIAKYRYQSLRRYILIGGRMTRTVQLLFVPSYRH